MAKKATERNKNSNHKKVTVTVPLSVAPQDKTTFIGFNKVVENEELPATKDFAAAMAMNLDFFLHSVSETFKEYRGSIRALIESETDSDKLLELAPQAGLFASWTEYLNDSAQFAKTMQEKTVEVYPELKVKDGKEEGNTAI